MSPEQEKYAEKIAKLLRKAENPGVSQAEADSFFEKAQALMTEYAIDEALVAAARGDNEAKAEEIIRDTITYTGIYHQALFDIGMAIAYANDAKVLISKGGKSTKLVIIGYESDVARIKMLDASIQIQAAGAMMKWWRADDTKDEYAFASGSTKFKARRGFYFGYAQGLTTLLATAKAKGKAAAKENETKRSGNADEASASVELVIKSKTDRVNDWFDEQYGRHTRGVSRNYARGGYSAQAAGSAAGRRADLGGGISGGARPQIGS